MQEFIARPDNFEDTLTHYHGHEDGKVSGDELLKEMKMEALLATENSPYLEVRANVDATDDPSMPSLTFRVLIIGSLASGLGSFVDTLFANRNPAILIGANVAQLLAYPIGKFMDRVLPKKTFRTFGREWSFNPGPFSQKEHMLITIVCPYRFRH